MKKQNKLTKEQEAQIYCIKNGHANYVWRFFGYVHCGRCGKQIGDQLASIFDTTNMITVGHKCDVCNNLKNELSKLDKLILSRLEEQYDAKESYDYEKILEGIKFK